MTLDRWLIPAAFLLVTCIAGTAVAKLSDTIWSTGTKLGFGKVGLATGTGVVTINGSFGGDHLTTLRIAPTDPMSGEPVPVTDPESTATVGTNIVDGVHGRGGTFAPISGAAMSSPLTQNMLPIAGVARVCLLFAGCGSSLNLPLTQNDGATGVGVGGLITIGGPGTIRISLVNSPWQLKTATRLQSTANGVVITRMHQGFLHGPESNTGSTARSTGSGVIQLISPIQVLTKGLTTNSAHISLFTSLTVHFVPEPGPLLLLGAGVVSLVLIGARRIQ
jgi:hypothetical protein